MGVLRACDLARRAARCERNGKPVSKKPYSNWVWEELGCGRKCPEQEGVEKARREVDQADAIRRRDEAYANARLRLRLLAGK